MPLVKSKLVLVHDDDSRPNTFAVYSLEPEPMKHITTDEVYFLPFFAFFLLLFVAFDVVALVPGPWT